LNTEPDRNFTWWNTSVAGDNIVFLGTFDLTGGASIAGSNWHQIKPDKDWMPYRYVEYEPKWHKKFARYKLQISKMWD